MIQTTVKGVLQGKVDHIDMSGIYTIRDGEHILYIGRSVDVTNRLHQHIEIWTCSAIGDLIHTNRPQSYSWQIEMRTPEECRDIVIQYSPFYRNHHDVPIGIETAELDMIMHHHPCWNTANNVKPNRLPAHIKRYDSPIEAGATDNLF